MMASPLPNWKRCADVHALGKMLTDCVWRFWNHNHSEPRPTRAACLFLYLFMTKARRRELYNVDFLVAIMCKGRAESSSAMVPIASKQDPIAATCVLSPIEELFRDVAWMQLVTLVYVTLSTCCRDFFDIYTMVSTKCKTSDLRRSVVNKTCVVEARWRVRVSVPCWSYLRASDLDKSTFELGKRCRSYLFHVQCHGRPSPP